LGILSKKLKVFGKLRDYCHHLPVGINQFVDIAFYNITRQHKILPCCNRLPTSMSTSSSSGSKPWAAEPRRPSVRAEFSLTALLYNFIRVVNIVANRRWATIPHLKQTVPSLPVRAQTSDNEIAGVRATCRC
jgi:hypothetical protein